MRMSLRFLTVTAALVLGTTLAVRADVDGDADLQFQLGSLLFDETRYREALDAFDRAIRGDDPALTLRARTASAASSVLVARSKASSASR